MFVEVNSLRLLIFHIDGCIVRRSNVAVRIPPKDIHRHAPSELTFHPRAVHYIKDTISKVKLCLTSRVLDESAIGELVGSAAGGVRADLIVPAAKPLERAIPQLMIKKILKRADETPCRVAVVFSDPDLVEQFQQSRVGTVYIPLDEAEQRTLDVYELCPDFIVKGEDVPAFFGGPNVGFFGEAVAWPHVRSHLAALFGIGHSAQVTGTIVRLPVREDPESEVWTSGRYFDLKRDFNKSNPLYFKHPLSLRLISAKGPSGSRTQAPILARIAFALLSDAAGEQGFDYVFPVPPRPNQPERPNRLKIILEEMLKFEPAKSIFTPANVRTDGLRCVRDIDSQKKSGTHARRKTNVLGAYSPTIDVKDKRVIVLDDIVTTKSTLMEIKRSLLAAGAKSVAMAAIAFHPYGMEASSAEPRLKCKCGGFLKPMPKKDGGFFFNCESWKRGDPGEKHSTEDFPQGIMALNEKTAAVLDHQLAALPEDVSFE